MKQKNFKAVILAGGKGTRLYPVTYEFPKSLLPVKKKPIINYLVDSFLSNNINQITVLISKDFEEDFKWWKKRYYSRKQISLLVESKPLGTFGGLWYLKDKLSQGDFFFSNGDDLKKIPLKKMIDFHSRKQVLATIALARVRDPQNYGVAICKNGLIQKFVEKPRNPPSRYISAGFYLLSPGIFKYHPGPKFSMVEKDLFPRLAKEGRLAGFKFQGRLLDCGTWERYEKALKSWKQYG